jgi:hypothetical protein
MTPSQAIFVIAMTMLGIFAAIGLIAMIGFIYLARHESIEHIDE